MSPSRIARAAKLTLQIQAGRNILQEKLSPLLSKYIDAVMPTRKIGATNPVNSLMSTDNASANPERTSHKLWRCRCQKTTKTIETAARAKEGSPIITDVLSRKNCGAMTTNGKKKMAASLSEVSRKN